MVLRFRIMMERKLLLILVAVLLFCFAGCKQDDTKEVKVTMEPFASSAKVYLDNNYVPMWHQDDTICVNGQALPVNNGSVTVPNDGTMHALYPAADMVSYSGGTYQVRLPRVQRYQADANSCQRITAPMAACGNDDQLKFVNLCSLLKVVVPDGVTVLNIDVGTTDSSAALSGCGTVTFPGNTPQFAFGTEAYPYTRLDCGTGVCRTDRTYYIVLPPFANKKLTITVCGCTENHKFRHTFTQHTTATLLQSQFAPVSLPAYTYQLADSLYAATDALCEPFSFSGSEKRYFSKGNLQFRTTPYSFRIADSQFVSIGSANSNISSSYSGWIDLFGWGTTGLSNCSVPWETRYDNSYYKVNSSESSSMTPATDWGANLGNWFTPSYQSWNYLLNARPHASEKVGFAVIDGVYQGLIILPDYWILPNNCSFSSTENNHYSLSQWSAMESAGALFLPAARRREGTNVLSEIDGYYWSSTRHSSSKAYCLHFSTSSRTIAMQDDVVHLGYSVRLVK